MAHIPRTGNEWYIFSGNLSTGTDLAINFGLGKCITKNKYSIYLNYNGKMEGGFSPKRQNISARCIFMVYSRETEASWCLIALSHTIHAPTS